MWPNRPENFRTTSPKIWWVSNGRSAWMLDLDRPLISPRGSLSSFSFAWTASPVHLPQILSPDIRTLISMKRRESSIQMDVTAKKEELNFFFFLIWYNFSGRGVFIRNGIFRFNGNPFVFVLSILFLVMHLCDENINRKSS